MKRFLLTLQFLTKIPIKYNCGFDDEFYKGLNYFPLVGLIIGIITYVLTKLFYNIFDTLVLSCIVVMIEVLLTGGLHIDGLGDTFDALYSYKDKEKMLEIMKDSRLGTNSLLAIVFVILLKCGFVLSFINNDMLWVILIMPMLSRFLLVYMTYNTKSPRKNGMGNIFIGKSTLTTLFITLVFSIVVIVILCKLFYLSNIIIISNFVVIAILILLVELFKKHVYSKIGGITGDILGCTVELSELFYLMIMFILIFDLSKFI